MTAVRDIGLADRAPTGDTFGCSEMSGHAKTVRKNTYDDRTSNPNKLLNFSPESKMQHRRGRQVKIFPVSD